MRTSIRSIVTSAAILAIASASMAVATDIPVAKETGPKGDVTVSVGMGERGPHSVSVEGRSGNVSGGVRGGTDGSVGISGGGRVGGAEVGATVTRERDGSHSATVGASVPW